MRTLATSLFLLFSVVAYSCSCFGPSDFCSVISDTLHGKDFVIMGKKISDFEHGMEIEIIQSFKNTIEEERIMVWGDLGWLCRKYTGGFEVGDTFYFNLHLIGTNSWSAHESADDFELSVCGQHFLNVKDGQAVGFINNSEAVQRIDINTFNSFLSDDLDCSNLDFTIADIDAVIYPNPIEESISVVSNQKISELELFDITGKMITKELPDRFGYRLETSNLNLLAGVYIVRVHGIRNETKSIRVVKF